MRLGIFLTVCLLTAALLVAVFAQVRFGDGNTYYAEFTNVTNLREGKLVRIAGVEVGKVEKISINPDATVRVEFSADNSVTLTEGTEAVIRYDNLFGDRYLALEEGAGGLEHTQSRPNDPAGPHQTRAGSGCADRRLQATVSRAEPRPGQCAERAAAAGIPGPGPHDRVVSGPGGGGDQHLGRPRSADRAGGRQPQRGAGFAGRPERPVGQGGDVAVAAGSRARRTQDRHLQRGGLHERRRRLSRRPAVAGPRTVFEGGPQTDRVADIALADHDYLDNLLNTLPDKYQALVRQGMYGDFFAFYLCDVVLKVNGKGGQPVYIKVAGQATGRCAPK